jgi:3-carboxy-cis,cis-muconate cycloisomerase
VLAAGALRRTAEMIEGLEVDPARMRENLAATRGQILAEAAAMALGAHIGRLEAHSVVAHASRQALATGRQLKEVLAEDPVASKHLSREELDRLFEPRSYIGMAPAFVERVLKGARKHR